MYVFPVPPGPSIKNSLAELKSLFETASMTASAAVIWASFKVGLIRSASSRLAAAFGCSWTISMSKSGRLKSCKDFPNWWSMSAMLDKVICSACNSLWWRTKSWIMCSLKLSQSSAGLFGSPCMRMVQNVLRILTGEATCNTSFRVSTQILSSAKRPLAEHASLKVG